MSKHTPGPWKIEWGEDSSGPFVAEICSENGDHIVDTESGNYPPYEADARLIAAAPDLLAVCKRQLAMGEPFSMHEAMRAAVDKAEGKS